MYIAADNKNKLIKRLNDLNQEVKYLYDEYYLFTDSGIIIADSEYDLSSNGIRMTVSLIDFSEFNGMCIKLISKDIYTVIKENKKDLCGILIEDSKIYLISNENRWSIGEVHENSKKPNHVKFKSICSLLNNFEELSSDDILTIVNNGMIILKSCGIGANATKDLIPGLKKNDIVKYTFSLDEDDKDLATLYIYHEKDKKIYTIHIYPIIVI